MQAQLEASSHSSKVVADFDMQFVVLLRLFKEIVSIASMLEVDFEFFCYLVMLVIGKGGDLFTIKRSFI